MDYQAVFFERLEGFICISCKWQFEYIMEWYRNTYYFVTSAGEKAIDAHKSRGESVMRDLLSVLSDADLEKLAQSLKNVNDVLELVVKE